MGFWSNPGLGMMAFYFLLTATFFMRLYKSVFYALFVYCRRLLGKNASTANDPREPVRTLLIGAGSNATAFILNSDLHGNRPRRILGIVDADPRKHGYKLHGVPIYGDDDNIPMFIERLKIDEIIITIPSIGNEKLREIVKLSSFNRCKVRLLSGLSSDKAGDKLRDIDINDLLGRPEAVLDMREIGEWLNEKTVLVTGGGGSIGGEICRQLLSLHKAGRGSQIEKLVIFDISENNAYNLKEELTVNLNCDDDKVIVRIGSVQDQKRLDEVFREFKPSVVFHAAAYKHVPLMEQCPRLALENNALGTYRTALCADRHNVQKFIMISTDKTIKPTNVMGATKRVAELLVLGLNERSDTDFVCVRFGNVLDSNGSVIPLFKRQIEAGGPVTVTHSDIIRYFMTIPEAAKLVLEAGAMAKGGEIFILDMGEPVKITELAESLIRLAGLTPHIDIKIEFTGLRPGEKLYEELLLNEEKITETLNEKIFVVQPAPAAEYEEIADCMESALPEEQNVRAWLKRFVPEYQYIPETVFDKEALYGTKATVS